jgi:hypothetical protein
MSTYLHSFRFVFARPRAPHSTGTRLRVAGAGVGVGVGVGALSGQKVGWRWLVA